MSQASKMMFYTVVWLSAVFLSSAGVNAQTTTTKTKSLRPQEMYQDMFPLTSQNFTDKLLRNKDPWIVVFHEGTLDRTWKTMATHLRGLCWVGLIDTMKEKELLKEIEFDASKDIARVYIYGGRLTKQRKWERVRTQNEARSMALASIPDKTVKIKDNDVHDFLLECFTTNPSRFATYLITDEDETPSLFKALSTRFEKYFHFGRLVRPTQEDLRKVGLEQAYVAPPALYVVVSEGGKEDKVNAIMYDSDKLGAMNYTNVMQFLFAVNTQFRYTLPGNNMASDKTEAEMADIVDIESNRFDIVDGSKHPPVKRVLRHPEPIEKPNLKFTGFTNRDEL